MTGDDRSLRCSDQDRESVAERLRMAAGDGRLTIGELEQRLESAFAARTYADLQRLIADLPPPPRRAEPSRSARVEDRDRERISAVLGGERRGGRWAMPRYLVVRSVLGSCTLDLTQAVVRHPEVVIDARLFFGGLTVVVPDGMDVRVEPGRSFLSDRTVRTTGRVTNGAPVLRICGTLAMANLTVRSPSRITTMVRHLFGS